MKTRPWAMQGMFYDEQVFPPARFTSSHPIHSAPEPPPDAKKIRRKRPKLDADRLLTPAGLPEVYGTFYDVFVQQYKGPGHEVRYGCFFCLQSLCTTAATIAMHAP